MYSIPCLPAFTKMYSVASKLFRILVNSCTSQIRLIQATVSNRQTLVASNYKCLFLTHPTCPPQVTFRSDPCCVHSRTQTEGAGTHCAVPIYGRAKKEGLTRFFCGFGSSHWGMTHFAFAYIPLVKRSHMTKPDVCGMPARSRSMSSYRHGNRKSHGQAECQWERNIIFPQGVKGRGLAKILNNNTIYLKIL